VKEPQPLPRTLAAVFKGTRAVMQAELDGLGVYPGQDYLLETLAEEDGLHVGEIARRLKIEVPTVVRTVQRLEAAGFVRRDRDPKDQRRSLVLLTDRGRAVTPAVRAALDAAGAAATTGFSVWLELRLRVRQRLRCGQRRRGFRWRRRKRRRREKWLSRRWNPPPSPTTAGSRPAAG